MSWTSTMRHILFNQLKQEGYRISQTSRAVQHQLPWPWQFFLPEDQHSIVFFSQKSSTEFYEFISSLGFPRKKTSTHVGEKFSSKKSRYTLQHFSKNGGFHEWSVEGCPIFCTVSAIRDMVQHHHCSNVPFYVAWGFRSQPSADFGDHRELGNAATGISLGNGRGGKRL